MKRFRLTLVKKHYKKTGHITAFDIMYRLPLAHSAIFLTFSGSGHGETHIYLDAQAPCPCDTFMLQGTHEASCTFKASDPAYDSNPWPRLSMHDGHSPIMDDTLVEKVLLLWFDFYLGGEPLEASVNAYHTTAYLKRKINEFFKEPANFRGPQQQLVKEKPLTFEELELYRYMQNHIIATPFTHHPARR